MDAAPAPPPAWGGDPSIAWRILLTARLAEPRAAEALAERQRDLHRAHGWAEPPMVRIGAVDQVRRDLAEVRDAPLVLGLCGDQLIVSAFHAYVDGLGLLEVLARLTDGSVATDARGVGERPTESGGTSGRLREVATAPPALLAPPRRPDRTPGDAFAVARVPGSFRTSDLVHAAARAVVAHNDDAGRRTRHLTIAVGAGRPAPGEPLTNRSELIRLRDLEGMSREEVRERVRSAPLSPAGGSGAGGGATVALALRALAPRLGATLLVSHLGTVTTDVASDLVFHPVTAGGTGLSLGAVTQDGTTALGLRGRARTWRDGDLAVLLDRVAASCR